MLFYKLTIGFILDLIFGDPAWLYHPIRLIGKLISVTERHLRNIFPKTKRGEIKAGAWLMVIVTVTSFIVPFAILKGLALIHPWLANVVELICVA